MESYVGKSSSTQVGPYLVELKDGGNGKILLSVSLDKNTPGNDSKGIVTRMVDVSDLQKNPIMGAGKVSLTGPLMHPAMMDRMEPVDNHGAGGLPSA